MTKSSALAAQHIGHFEKETDLQALDFCGVVLWEETSGQWLFGFIEGREYFCEFFESESRKDKYFTRGQGS